MAKSFDAFGFEWEGLPDLLFIDLCFSQIALSIIAINILCFEDIQDVGGV